MNLGGWLVLEPFITPSLFEDFDDVIPVDEYHYCKYLGQEEAKTRLTKHWNSWITEGDFYKIKGYGFNTVRLPIGYWAFELVDDDPFVQGAAEYLDKSLEWARSAGLKVWIDLHGHRGSQNAFDNSGLRDEHSWYDENVTLSLKVVKEVTEKYGQSNYSDVVSGIQLINEPKASLYDITDIKKYFEDGYEIVRNGSSSTPVILQDSFLDVDYWNDYMSSSDYTDVVMDTHQYQFVTTNKSLTIDDFVQNACDIGELIKNATLKTITGEWTSAMTDCTKWVGGGVGLGHYYDGTKGNDSAVYIGSCDEINNINEWSEERKVNTRKFVEAQMDAYEQGEGWIFWTYRTERAVEWSVETLISKNLFPQPLTERKYSNQCGY